MLDAVTDDRTAEAVTARRVEIAAGIDSAGFAAIRAGYRPVVMTGLVASWPAVAAGREGVAAITAYLTPLDSGAPTTVFSAPPENRGKFFYRDDMRGLNFGTQKVPLSRLLASLVELADAGDPPSLYAGATPTAESMSGFAAANPLPIGFPGAEPRIWVGNASRIATHYDMSPNVACVVAGRRRFTLFPPEQIANLYVGPVDRTPAGQPASMVDPLAPDLDRYPRFAEAAAVALVADLEPGDALFVPPMWWHHVQAFGPLNVLVNYWAETDGQAFPALMHAVAAIRDLPQAEREAWRAWFEHYVFGPAAVGAVDHLPDHARGVLGAPSPDRDRMIRSYLMGSLAGRS